ncbi:beta-N-acetylglucosaminidase domain-containing protein [Streptomyces sp. CRN 30]|uniref:beta-N-acetylglucosaminidase domain-containing protein n=1 Tax=Streptomyces sp. CRN 30 TaxID=3075613 RepID=UPI002A820FF7|nr:beta-N-acetylglucosaminidase domain-containing protein [Streptomyces sp. CRN 30]
MRHRYGKGAAAVAIAVVAGALGGASPLTVPTARTAAPDTSARPAPAAVPDSPRPSTAAPDTDTAAPSGQRSTPAPDRPAPHGTVPAVWPRPQSLSANGAGVAVTEEVVLVADASADPHAVDVLRELLLGAGAREVTTVREGAALPAGALVVRAGEEAADGAAAPDAERHVERHAERHVERHVERALTALGAEPRADLPSGGYRLAVGRVGKHDTVALAGVGEDGLFHAAQTLRRLVTEGASGADGTRRIAGVVVRDWPGTAVRGVSEGFYGTPWTAEQRLAQLDFMGRTKQNRYVYAPGDDLHRQARWREPYPARQQAEFRELAERADRNHVTLTWAVAPGQAMCFSSADDVRALTRKLDAMAELGFRAFHLQFQDVSYTEWHCRADAEEFGTGPGAAARAQARVADAVARHLAARQPEAAELTVMPTEYYQDGPTEYRDALTAALDDGIQVAWTGIGVVPRTITGEEVARTRAAFAGHPLVTVDNYPVNDYAQDRVFLGPYTGRQPAVGSGSAALLATAMQQAEASRIPLFTVADYAWNPRSYRPEESWRAAIDDLAQGDPDRAEALTALAGNTASSVLGSTESAYLRPLLDDFWQARTATDRAAAERRLRAAFTVLREVPDRLAGSPLAAEVEPWTGQLARYGEAGEGALAMLRAQEGDDATAAWAAYRSVKELRARLGETRATVGEGVLDAFLDRAVRAYDTWAGLDHAIGTGAPEEEEAGAGDGRFGRVRTLTAVTVLAEPGTDGTVEAHVPGEGWRPLGTLARGGATEIRPREAVRADALRVTGGPVRHLVPWYADEPAVSLELTNPETDVELGGERTVTARLTSGRPTDVPARLTARAPAGIKVKVPSRTTVPRGTAVDVPVKVTVPAGTPSGTYEVEVALGAGETRTLTVRAFPRTAGDDLARGAAATSSADETPDFPATAAGDGDAGTRWSSPAEDGAWWQTELPRPVRLGQVVLHWQDAYAAEYRVQVSADGRTWRTAAAVRHGGGGREAIRMDERDVRFVRVQGVERATEYGYSLWSVEAYAVAEEARGDR